MRHWLVGGRYDDCSVDRLIQEFPNTTYHLVGHSAGGQLFGLMPNHDKFTSVFNVACSSGQIRNMAMPYRAKTIWFMDVFIPVSNVLFGYTQSSKIGMGEDLPKTLPNSGEIGAMAQAISKPLLVKQWNPITMRLTCLLCGWNAPDDDIANDKNVADMIGCFPTCKPPPNDKTKDYGFTAYRAYEILADKTSYLAANPWLVTNMGN